MSEHSLLVRRKLGNNRNTCNPEWGIGGSPEVRDVQKVIAALASPVRREILALVWDRELRAGEIAAAFDVTKPTISQHLSVLRHAGLVSVVPAGTSRRYRAQPDALAGLRGALSGSSKWTNVEDA